MRRFLLVLLLITAGYTLKASHLVGGNLAYEYLGPNGANYQYKIILTVYNNCDNNSNVPLPVASYDVSIYQHDVSGNPMGGANKTLYTTVTLPLVDSNKVNLPIPGNCPPPPFTQCTYKGVYETIVDLPVNFNGYHLYFENFARNAAIQNILNPGAVGMAFHAYIPPTLVVNSSPVFSDDPVPLLCTGDTTTILNTAFDPDGDLLIFSFIDPLDGTAGGPPNPLPWPLPTVPYNTAGGYNLAQPFGPGGYSFINGSTGLTQYYAPNGGQYVVAVEIREYRNGNLIGVSRRDLQLFVSNQCTPNTEPNLSNSGGSGQTSYTIFECDSLSFPITFNDLEGDMITLIPNGPIFDSSFINPPASIDTMVIGVGTVTTTFSWTPPCGAGQALPYLFTVTAQDSGCYPQTENVVYSITVNPPTPPDTLIGPITVCEGQTETYSTDTIAGYVYTWSVTGGVIVSGQGTSSVDVLWNNVGSGNIQVYGTTDCGCPTAFIDTNITILASPNADAGFDQSICLGDSVQIGGSPTGPFATTISWSPGVSLDNPSNSNPFAFPTSTTQYVVLVDNGTCSSTDTVNVIVNPNFVDAGVNTSICFGDTTQLNAVGGTSYSWSPGNTLSNSSIFNPLAYPTSTTTYYLNAVDSFGCNQFDSVIVFVNNPPSISITNDTTICQSACIQMNATGGVSYAWNPGSTLNDSTIANPIACPLDTTTYQVVVTDTAGCIDSATVTVNVSPAPIITVSNNTSICIGDCASLTASGGNTYSWSPGNTLNDSTIANPIACPTTTTNYIVYITDSVSCTLSDTVVVTVNPLPVVDAGTDQNICGVGSVVIGGSPTAPSGSTIVWNPGSTLNDSTIFNPTASPTTTTQYIAYVTDSNSCANTDTVIVNVFSLPNIDAGVDTTICLNDSVQIGGSPTGPLNSTYTWTPSIGLNDTTLSNPMASPPVTTTYYVTVTDSNGCTGMDSITVNVNPLPTVTIVNDTAICTGNCVTISAGGGISYEWTPGNSLNDSTLSNPTACPSSTTNYTVNVTDVNGCSDTGSVLVTVNPLPVVNAGPDISLCIGDSIQIGGSPTGPSGATYSWAPSVALNNTNIPNPTSGATVNTTYIVTVTDSNLCVNTDTMDLTINPLPIVEAGNDTSICIGNTANLGGNPTGPSGAAFVWNPGNTLNDSTIANPTATPNTTTTYIVTVTDTNGCVNTDSVMVTVNPLPSITISNDTSICLNQCANISASGGTIYNWTPGITLNDSTISNPIACPLDTTTYLVNVTDANGCSDTASVTVSIIPLPNIQAGPDVWLCPGDSIGLNAQGGTSYTWTPGASLSDSTIAAPMSGASDTTSYVVFGTGVNGCINTDTIIVFVNPQVPIDPGTDTTICPGDTIMLGGNPTSPNGTSFIWTPNINMIGDTTANPLVFPNTTTTYYVYATNDTCNALDSVVVTVLPAPNVNAGNDINICIGDTAQLNGSGGITYNWTPGVTLSDSLIANPLSFAQDTTQYILEVTDLNGCKGQDTMILFVHALPDISAGGTVLNMCKGDTVQLNASGGVAYTWTPNSSISDTSVANPNIWPVNDITYYVVGTDINGCMNNDSILIDVFTIPSINDTTICIGTGVQLQAPIVAGGTYNWTPGTGLSDSTISNPIASPLVNTTYLVTVTDSNGCSDTASVFVSVLSNPTADFSVDLNLSCEEVEGDFINNSLNATTYLWNFGDGETSTAINPSHSFNYNGSINVTLIAYNSSGCADTAIYNTTIGDFKDSIEIIVPTVFTPNGDGVNDVYEVKVQDNFRTCVDLKIFNRWGQLLFESNGATNMWDGRTNAGVKVPAGTYFYIIDIQGIEFKGTLTLLE